MCFANCSAATENYRFFATQFGREVSTTTTLTVLASDVAHTVPVILNEILGRSPAHKDGKIRDDHAAERSHDRGGVVLSPLSHEGALSGPSLDRLGGRIGSPLP